MTRQDLISYVKRQLGYPTVNVELTDDQINDAINSAIDEIKPWYTIFKYLTIDVNSSCIDLSEYDILEVTDVIKVLDRNQLDSSDPFSSSDNLVVSSIAVPNSRLSSSNVHKIISDHAKGRKEQFYSHIATIIENRTAGMLYENISWKFYDDKLYIDTGHPKASVVTIEYISSVREVEDVEENTKFMRDLQNLSVAFSQITLARVTGKYVVSGSPSSINYRDMRDEARSEIDRIRSDLRRNANVFYITD